MITNLKVHVSRDEYVYDGCALHLAQSDGANYSVLKLDIIEAETIPKGQARGTHPMYLENDGAQAILQALWNAGYRPNNGESTKAHVDALKYHLEDMRKLVFK